jgi:hypothetical protein
LDYGNAFGQMTFARIADRIAALRHACRNAKLMTRLVGITKGLL